jgi:hypothetical protein
MTTTYDPTNGGRMATIEMLAPDMTTLGAAAQTVRRERAAIKAGLRAGTTTLRDLMTDPPAVIEDVALIDVIRWTRRRSSAGAGVAHVGAMAVRDRVNLMMAVGRASERSRLWVAEHGGYGRWGARP